ncbi:hypothetical protein FZC83_02330 [Rossellomorea marisflavi]|uniref:Phage portal protein n=1 Tax=Rossellomorea marisflavi TaxID=189381 RepID=A0A5D4S2V0_9BACI|nr:hypothetical protein [Rossellomorea marisflavi]TYS56434.1 hypothetical protein FZC83_02330 [Rossellomorea marisflavi]
MSNDEKAQDFTQVNFAAQLSKLILNDLNNTSNRSSLTIKYTKEQIMTFLDNPRSSQKQIRNLSEYLYMVSSNYKRLIQYFSGMLRFDYIVEPYNLDITKVNKETFNKQYFETIHKLETMNLPHEFTKILKHAFRDDVFYGYEYSGKESYFIQRLDPDYCKISSIEDGVYNFSFDFSFFKNIKEVKKYPEEFQDKYTLFKKDASAYRWQELDSENTICFKVNEELDFPLPPFTQVFEAIYDIDENKRMRRIKTKMDNYMILTQKIPLDEKKGEPNKFLIDLDTAIAFHNKASESLPEEVGLITSPMDIEAIKLERKNNDYDNVAEAERNYYNAAGVSQLLFNGAGSTSTALSKSVITDEQIVFMCLQQFERWINRKLKQIGKGKYKFRVRFLETTRFNVQEVREGFLKAAQYGMPVKSALAATLGLTPSNLVSMAFLENELLDLPNKLIPLASSHTSSNKDGAGAPMKSDDDLSESGEKTRDTDGNIRD